MDEEILSIILSNIRIADQRIGDIKAQAAALTVGDRRLTLLLDRYGKDVVEEAIIELKKRAAQQMRAKIATIPDGVYEGESFVDSDGVVNEPLRIAMKIQKGGTSLTFDMAESSPPCLGPMNSVIATTNRKRLDRSVRRPGVSATAVDDDPISPTPLLPAGPRAWRAGVA